MGDMGVSHMDWPLKGKEESGGEGGQPKVDSCKDRGSGKVFRGFYFRKINGINTFITCVR